MNHIKNSSEIIEKYNKHKDEMYRIECYYNKRIHRLISIATSISQKSLGNKFCTLANISKDKNLEWLLYSDTIRPAYWFIIECITDEKIRVIMHKKIFGTNKWEEKTVYIPQKMLRISDREFAKFIRQQIKEYKINEKQKILQNFDKNLEQKTKDLKTLESEINYMHKLKKESEKIS